jgi:hypothetical protein
MQIELKNIKVNLTFSQETTMFDADIYVDGVKIGYAENGGQGGCTSYSAIGKQQVKTLRQAEAFCESLPKEIYEGIELSSNLEGYIDNLVDQFVNKREEKRFANKLKKDLTKFVCYSKLNKVDGCKEYNTIRFTNYCSLEEIFSTPRLKEKVETMMSELKAEGFYILNANLPI